MLSCGIVGLPNVGKSTFFNAITKTELAQAQNFPFCTIEPNIAQVDVVDNRLKKLSLIIPSQKIIFNKLKIIDIAGLVKGASTGEGLGNQFLSNIREVDLILHLVRCFADSDIQHVNGSVDPLFDIELIETELILADIQSLEKRIIKDKKNKEKLLQVLKFLESGRPAREINFVDKEELNSLQLITTKSVLYISNVDEKSAVSGNSFSQIVTDLSKKQSTYNIIISAKVESEIAMLDLEEDRLMFLSDIGLKSSGLDNVLSTAYSMLNLITFFTVGPQEARAWKIVKGMFAPEAAGVIHTDFEKKFIKAETISYDDYIKYNGESAARDAGKMRSEGRDYVVSDGDVLHFRHG